MTNNAVVTRLLTEDTAEVAVVRITACGGNCGSCEACKCDSDVRVIASNPQGAKPGQKVVIESRSADILGAAAIVYILPIVLLFAGYIVGASAGAGEGMCVLLAFTAVLLGTVISVAAQRRKKNESIKYNIIKIN